MILLQAWIWDLPFQLLHDKFVIYHNFMFGPQLIQVLLILNFMGKGV